MDCLLFPNPLSCLTWARTQGCNQTTRARTCLNTHAKALLHKKETQTLSHNQTQTNTISCIYCAFSRYALEATTTRDNNRRSHIMGIKRGSPLGKAMALLLKSLNAFTLTRYLDKVSPITSAQLRPYLTLARSFSNLIQRQNDTHNFTLTGHRFSKYYKFICVCLSLSLSRAPARSLSLSYLPSRLPPSLSLYFYINFPNQFPLHD